MENRLFNDGWQFKKISFTGEESSWKSVDLPHDWHIYNAKELYEDGEGWYKKSFEYYAHHRRTFIRFDGVYMDTTVWVNEHMVGVWKYGYSTFEYEITAFLKEGANDIKVRTIFKNPNSRWYSGAGIYRNVWIRSKPTTCLVSDGTYISSTVEGNVAKVIVSTEVDFSVTSNKGDYNIFYEILTDEGLPVASAEKSVLEEGTTLLNIDSPVCWDIDNPYRYTMRVNLREGERVVEKEDIRFGVRTIAYDSEHGFYLNGRHVKFYGVCMHHDLGCLGAAINTVAIKRQLSILKRMGVNAVRTAHNMAAPELIEAADEMGILINAESFDMWRGRKTEYDYARFFDEWAERDVASWVRRDRNHPSIVMWCIGNEIYDTHGDERGQETTRMLMEYVYAHDPRHNAPVTIGSNYMPWENAKKCADIVKIAGYNYAEAYYAEHHKEHPDWIIYGSETASVVQSRGIYHFPESTSILDDDDLQCSSLGNSTTSWGARSIDACIAADRDATYSAGMFIWSGFDYIGEPTPYHTKNSYFGQIDTAGFPKDAYYLYKAEWTDYMKEPMIHIYPYWDFNIGQQIDVMVTSNAPKVELFLNGESLGVKEIDHINGTCLVAKWRVLYQKGVLSAVAYDEKGIIIAEDKQVSFGDPAEIILTPNKMELDANGLDLIFVEISMNDSEGNPVHNACNRVQVSVSGAARLIGLDNGDSTDYDAYKGTSRRLFSGKLLAVLAAKEISGSVTLLVESVGLPSKELILNAKSCMLTEGISAQEENQVTEYTKEIPIRKLEIITEKTTLSKDCIRTKARVEIYPENATYDQVVWRATNDHGVTSNLVQLIPEGKEVTIIAKGDGEFRLRCVANNAKDYPEIISQIEYKIEDLGVAYADPYGFISGSLYASSKGDITNGNERGAATPRDHSSYLLYDNINFGDWGSDEITIPIFELESRELVFEIWEGMPYEMGSEKLLDACYNKPSIWNTYQEETFVLNRRVSGVTSIGFVFHRKAHIKGFSFDKNLKAFEQLSILDNTSVYGDSYLIREDAIEGIGNNVTFVYENMDFSGRPISKVTICGRTPLDKNTIHIRFKDGERTINQIIEFSKASEYDVQEFELEQVEGLFEVLFIFMPGSDFDCKWFQFK